MNKPFLQVHWNPPPSDVIPNIVFSHSDAVSTMQNTLGLIHETFINTSVSNLPKNPPSDSQTDLIVKHVYVSYTISIIPSYEFQLRKLRVQESSGIFCSTFSGLAPVYWINAKNTNRPFAFGCYDKEYPWQYCITRISF